MARTTPGIDTRHAKTCPASRDHAARCKCAPSYQAHVWSAREGKRIRKTFSTLAAAKAWRSDAVVALRRVTMRAPTELTLRQTWETWLAGAREGSVRNRSGDLYKPSVLRGYETSMRLRVLPELGGARLSDITHASVQDLADRTLAAGLDASTIRNTLMPLRAIFRRALARGDVSVNPIAGIELPAVRGKRDRIASPLEAAALIAALPEEDQAVWATAFYAGLRLGELWALRDEDVDLEAGVIRVERSWDRREGVIEPKSRAGRRAVPIVAALRSHLAARKLRRGSGGALFFGSQLLPFNRDQLVARAVKAWKQAELTPIGLHEGRHTFASILIAAGVNAKALSTYLGHSSIQITLDRYGHLMPGNEEEAVALVDAYLERATVLRQSATVGSGF
ncbi:MAG: tyrosine-type recombinase/integrase [Gaiellaceae bacterium]